MVHFKFNEKKAAEALAYVATKWDNITQFYAAKVLFFAEKQHINKYARPIVADTFIAMKDGPVPTKVYDLFKGNFLGIKERQFFDDAVTFKKTGWTLWSMKAKRQPDLSLLSETDINCLDAAIEFCRGKEKNELSEISHKDPSWKETKRNRSMDYSLMVDNDNPHRSEILEELNDFSKYGIL